MQGIKTLKDFNFSNKRVLVRTDYNVPLDDDGNITDSKRILDSIDTLKYLLEKDVKQITIITHVGRPKNNEEKLKTDVIAKELSKILNLDVKKIDSWNKENLDNYKIIIYENLRFNENEKSEDEKKRDEFAKLLSKNNDIFVMEAFSNMHRANEASMTSILKFIPSCVGFAVEKEINTILSALENPIRPYVAIIGGVKADKLDSIRNIMKSADKVLVGGALGFLFNYANGFNVGKTKVDYDAIENVKKLLLEDIHNKIIYPIDCIVADNFSNEANFKNVNIDEIEDNFMALDIGEETIKLYSNIIKDAKTITWNGPIGVFEFENFSVGTKKISDAISKSIENGAKAIIGGGDSAAAIEKFGYKEKMNFVSTGGGASLMMFEGLELPVLKKMKEYSNNFN
jgi:3-phosphoglycerate kinase